METHNIGILFGVAIRKNGAKISKNVLIFKIIGQKIVYDQKLVITFQLLLVLIVIQLLVIRFQKLVIMVISEIGKQSSCFGLSSAPWTLFGTIS